MEAVNQSFCEQMSRHRWAALAEHAVDAAISQRPECGVHVQVHLVSGSNEYHVGDAVKLGEARARACRCQHDCFTVTRFRREDGTCRIDGVCFTRDDTDVLT